MNANGTEDTEDTAPEFAAVLDRFPPDHVRSMIARADDNDVRRALEHTRPGLQDLAALLSPAAARYLEPLARRAAALTRRRFGRVMQFYVPLYLSNHCTNACAYCGFNCRNPVERRRLSIDEAVAEAEFLADEGFRHLLLVSGEDPQGVSLSYLRELVSRIRNRFASINIEVYPMDVPAYASLVRAGVDSITQYQETYDRRLYARVHLAGPKRDFDYRLGTVERAARGGITFLGVGALLGLGDWRTEAFYVGLHARWLQRRFWRQHVSISFPRMRRAAGAIPPEYPVGDADLVQIIGALRLLCPDAGLVLSTREPARLRDHLMRIGITRMSAGSRTAPGAYTNGSGAEKQFEILDHRPLREVMQAAARAGLDPVCKDWDPAFH